MKSLPSSLVEQSLTSVGFPRLNFLDPYSALPLQKTGLWWDNGAAESTPSQIPRFHPCAPPLPLPTGGAFQQRPLLALLLPSQVPSPLGDSLPRMTTAPPPNLCTYFSLHRFTRTSTGMTSSCIHKQYQASGPPHPTGPALSSSPPQQDRTHNTYDQHSQYSVSRVEHLYFK